jgi:hypothetical protein
MQRAECGPSDSARRAGIHVQSWLRLLARPDADRLGDILSAIAKIKERATGSLDASRGISRG